MAITLVEELPKMPFSGKTLAYFFFDSSSEDRKTATAMLRGLLWQLITQHPQLVRFLLPKYSAQKQKLFTSFDALWNVFLSAANDFASGEKYFIIDALDECQQERDLLLKALYDTFQPSGPGKSLPNIRILITSRPYPEIKEELQQFNNKDLSSFDRAKWDVEVFIREKVAGLQQKKRYTPKVAAEVLQILMEKAEGTFLWVGIACEELSRCASKDAVKTLQKLPRGLHSLYKVLLDTALDYEQEQGEEGKETIKRILSFVTVAQRPLSLRELSITCRLHEDQEQAERLAFTQEEIEQCRLMVIIQDNKVLLLHKSVKDFLVGSDNGHFIHELRAHADFAYRCIDYLLEHPYDKWAKDNAQFLDYRTNGWREPKEPYDGWSWHDRFLHYSTEFWAEHAHLAEFEFAVKDRHAEFFGPRSKSLEGWLRYDILRVEGYPRTPEQLSILHIAARRGIAPLVNHALAGGDLMGHEENRPTNKLFEFLDAKFATAQGTTPLAEAAGSGHVAILLLLLNLGPKDMRILDCVTEAAVRNQRNGKEVIALLLDRRGDQIPITEEVVEAAVGNLWNGSEVLALLLDQRGGRIPITEEVVKAAAGNKWCGQEVIALLLDRRGDQIPITEEVVETAAGNEEIGDKVMRLLLDRRSDRISITEKVVKTAAGNRIIGKEVIALLLDRRGDQVPITEDVAKAGACNYGNETEVMALLLDRRGDQVPITEEVVKAAAGNEESGKEMVALLLDRRGDQVPITEEVVKAAAGNWRNGKEVMALLLDRRGDQIQITEEVVNASVRNSNWDTYYSGDVYSRNEVMALLLDRRGDQIPITEKVVEASVRDKEIRKRVITLLLNRQGDQASIVEKIVQAATSEEVVALLQRNQIPITEGVAKSIAGHFNAKIMALLLDRRGDQVPITEEVVKAAAGNWRDGKEVMALLLDQRGDQIPITDEVVKAAAGNGKEVMALLLDQRGDQIPITDEVAKAAERNWLC
jgi:hypothetical protein